MMVAGWVCGCVSFVQRTVSECVCMFCSSEWMLHNSEAFFFFGLATERKRTVESLE